MNQSKNSRFRAALISGMLIAAFIACDKDDNGSSPDYGESVVTFYNNIDDALILSILSEEGDSVAYFGEKNAQGVPTAVTSAIIYLRDQKLDTGDDTYRYQNETAYISLEGYNGLPSKIITSDFTFQFEWESESQVVITTIENEGSARSQVALDLTDTPESRSFAPPEGIVQPRTLADRPDQALSQRTAPADRMIPDYLKSSSSTITVEQCGIALKDARVTLQLVQDGVFNNYHTNEVAPGSYLATLPVTGQALYDKVDDACMASLDYVSYGCEAADHMKAMAAATCAKIVLSTAVAPPVAAVLGKACVGAFGAYALYCLAGDWTPTLPFDTWSLGMTPKEMLCKSIAYTLDRGLKLDGGDITYNVNMFHASLGASWHDNLATTPATGPYPNPSISLEGEQEVLSFSASPGNPPPGVGYTAHAQLACVEPGSTIGISIVGTDGYSDSTSCAASETNQSCSLYVPGAEGGVKDFLTLTVNGVEMQTLEVVFGGGGKSAPLVSPRMSGN